MYATVKKCSFSEAPDTTWQHTSTLGGIVPSLLLELASNVFDRRINVIFPDPKPEAQGGASGYEVQLGTNVALK